MIDTPPPFFDENAADGCFTATLVGVGVLLSIVVAAKLFESESDRIDEIEARVLALEDR